MYHVEGYWKVRLVCLLILVAIAVGVALDYRVNTRSKEDNAIYHNVSTYAKGWLYHVK